MSDVLIDLFCGGGGTSTGMRMAWELLGKTEHDYEMIAVNHWSVAIDTHTANHPGAAHHCKSLAEIGDPCKLITSRNDRRVKLLWASPECTGHSRARGGKPANDQSRSSANLVLDFLDKLNVETLMIENVREFVDWGPLGVDNRPLKSKKGSLFKHWLEGLRVRGYKYEWRILNCADYGTPTTRQRFFLIAVKGNRTIRWPEPTHIGPAEQKRQPLFADSRKPWVPARDIIDWSDLGKDIFTERKKALADNTMERIRAGARRFWGIEMDVAAMVHAGVVPLFVDMAAVSAADLLAWKKQQPFIPEFEFRLLDNFVGLPTMQSYQVDLHGTATVHGIDKPVQTITAGGGHVGVVSPIVLPHRVFEEFSVDSPDVPLRTITGTQTVTGSKGEALVSPFIAEYYGTRNMIGIEQPLPTLTTRDRFALVAMRLDQVQSPEWLPVGAVVSRMAIFFRMLRLAECARAQSFPDDYKWTGTAKEQQVQVGNAVPPQMAMHLTLPTLAQGLRRDGMVA
ncbi:hypothetical protein GOB94_13975 [Granulicella sp. 5B5]|uniref:DNA cytosine methyltransferase n=1 Tax=Granulicella sp. 5B5 TaxID=1617967 RepID=UPI0015F4298D|nr:DNA cytosine methyltransferase [Granulicella sp. 5B5]QMV19673.1 hypothetical protein GOB94_13975 [Granulicella sp. 5B5]